LRDVEVEWTVDVEQHGAVSWVLNWRLYVHRPSLPNKNLLTTRTRLHAFCRSHLLA